MYTVTEHFDMPYLYTMIMWGDMPCVDILGLGGVPYPVSVYRDRLESHVLCLYTLTRWDVMSCG